MKKPSSLSSSGGPSASFLTAAGFIKRAVKVPESASATLSFGWVAEKSKIDVFDFSLKSALLFAKADLSDEELFIDCTFEVACLLKKELDYELCF